MSKKLKIIIGSVIGGIITIGTITGIAVGVTSSSSNTNSTSLIVKKAKTIKTSDIKVNYQVSSITWLPTFASATINIPTPTIDSTANYTINTDNHVVEQTGKVIGDTFTVTLNAKEGYQFEKEKTTIDYIFYTINPFKINRSVDSFRPTSTNEKIEEKTQILNFLKSKHTYISESLDHSSVTLTKEETTNTDNTKNEMLKVSIADGLTTHNYYMLPQKLPNENVGMKEKEYVLTSVSGNWKLDIPYGINEINVSSSAIDQLVATRTKNVFLPDTLISISDNGFFSYTELDTLSLPKSLKYIGKDAFGGTRLASQSTMIIPEGVTNIGRGAFRIARLTSLTLPNSVKKIGAGAFETSLFTSLVIPDSVTEIGTGAFARSPLTSLTIPTRFTHINNVQKYFLTPENGRLKLVVGEGVTIIPDDFWISAFNFKDVELPDSLEVIGRSAFNTSDKTSWNIPINVTTIKKNAFVSAIITNLVLPYSLVTIEEFAFEAAQLNSLVLPPNLETIGVGAFSFSPLTSLVLPSSLRSIGHRAFQRSQIESLIIPQGVVSIGALSFEESPLQSLTIAASVTNIEALAFKNIQTKEVTFLSPITTDTLTTTQVFGTNTLTDTDTPSVSDDIWIKRS